MRSISRVIRLYQKTAICPTGSAGTMLVRLSKLR